MHDLVLARLQTKPTPVLAQLPLDGGSLLAAFAPQPRGSMLWLAKTAYGASACLRLQAEANALTLLAPVAATLQLPQLLAFSAAGEGQSASACLLQTALPGRPLRCRWLQLFQDCTANLPLPRPSLADLGAAVARDTRLALQRQPQLQPLLAWVLDCFAAPGPACPAVAIHGDFWFGNVMWNSRPPSLGVIDWSSFGVGSALDDLLTWMTHLPAGRSGRYRAHVEVWPAVLLASGSPRQMLCDWARRASYDAATARYAFYLFLARRLLWELGFGLQQRDADECARAQRDWSAVLAWLTAHGFPDPVSSQPQALRAA
ncbi:MAG: phosphotransferase [Terriglobales bacterium]